MTGQSHVLLVDDLPEKLLAYEVILQDLGENLVKASSAREALQFLLKNDVAVVLVDVCMPELTVSNLPRCSATIRGSVRRRSFSFRLSFSPM